MHGALLDTELLAEVYFAMSRGQESLLDDDKPATIRQTAVSGGDGQRPVLRIFQPAEAELAAHAQQLLEIDKASKGACLWKQLEAVA